MLLTRPCWICRAELSSWPLTSTPVSRSQAPGTPPRAHTPAWSVQHLQGQSRGCQIHRAVLAPSCYPFNPVRTPRKSAGALCAPSRAQIIQLSSTICGKRFNCQQFPAKGDAALVKVHAGFSSCDHSLHPAVPKTTHASREGSRQEGSSPAHLPLAPVGPEPPGPDRKAGSTWSRTR